MNKTLKFIALVIFFFVTWSAGSFLQLDFEVIRKYLSSIPMALSGVVFVFLYIFITFFIWLGPKDFFRITGAILFGPYVSTVYIFIAEMFNATILFSLSRRLGRGYIVEKFKLKDAQLTQIDQINKNSSFLNIMALRINPLIPFRFLDLGYGLTAEPQRKYLTAVAGVSILRIFWLQSILSIVGESFLKDPQVLKNLLSEQPQILFYSGIYFVCILILTIVAGIGSFLKRRGLKKS
ncbi:MAG: TVP38/TMEM64 family protein [Candidatus Omnitrophica bacterium]|nr:TVP38/TMEM64 family protein [Candidatus Omnitrophota bacterium]